MALDIYKWILLYGTGCLIDPKYALIQGGLDLLDGETLNDNPRLQINAKGNLKECIRDAKGTPKGCKRTSMGH